MAFIGLSILAKMICGGRPLLHESLADTDPPLPNADFYRASCNADAVSVRPSVCLTVCQTRALWQNRRKICPDFFILYERPFSL